jgi:(S)-2-hydroxy-acid oxidase
MSKVAPTEHSHDLNCLTISELEHHAAQRMTKQTKDYYDEGADSGSTLRENLSAYAKYRIRPRVLRNISAIDTSKMILGHRNTVPFGVAPTAMQCLAHPDGELATARACKKRGIIMGLSSFATTSLEDVAKENGSNPRVLQLYLFEEREHTVKMLKRAKKAGYKAVFLTVDTPMLGRRNLDLRNQFKLPKPYKIANFDQDSTSDETATVMGNSPSDDNKQQKQDERKEEASQVGYLHPETKKRVPPSGKITFHTHAANPTLNWENDIT